MSFDRQLEIVSANIEQTLAGKNGRFQFEGEGIEAVMKQVASWYDVEIVYEGKPKEQHFHGGISRMAEASKVLQMLEDAGVKFRMEGKKLIVL